MLYSTHIASFTIFLFNTCSCWIMWHTAQNLRVKYLWRLFDYAVWADYKKFLRNSQWEFALTSQGIFIYRWMFSVHSILFSFHLLCQFIWDFWMSDKKPSSTYFQFLQKFEVYSVSCNRALALSSAISFLVSSPHFTSMVTKCRVMYC